MAEGGEDRIFETPIDGLSVGQTGVVVPTEGVVDHRLESVLRLPADVVAETINRKHGALVPVMNIGRKVLHELCQLEALRTARHSGGVGRFDCRPSLSSNTRVRGDINHLLAAP